MNIRKKFSYVRLSEVRFSFPPRANQEPLFRSKNSKIFQIWVRGRKWSIIHFFFWLSQISFLIQFASIQLLTRKVRLPRPCWANFMRFNHLFCYFSHQALKNLKFLLKTSKLWNFLKKLPVAKKIEKVFNLSDVSKFPVQDGFTADLSISEMRSVKTITFCFLPSQSKFYKIFHAYEQNINYLFPWTILSG